MFWLCPKTQKAKLSVNVNVHAYWFPPRPTTAAQGVSPTFLPEPAGINPFPAKKNPRINMLNEIVCMLHIPLHLPRRLDALNDGQADYGPGRQQGQGHLPVDAARVVDAAGDVEGLAVPEVSGGRAPLALRLHHFGGKRRRRRRNS